MGYQLTLGKFVHAILTTNIQCLIEGSFEVGSLQIAYEYFKDRSTAIRRKLFAGAYNPLPMTLLKARIVEADSIRPTWQIIRKRIGCCVTPSFEKTLHCIHCMHIIITQQQSHVNHKFVKHTKQYSYSQIQDLKAGARVM
jgi:hypothetical protein